MANDTDVGRFEGELQYAELFRGYPAPLLHFATVCCVLFIFLGVPGNLGTIVALYRCKKVRNATAVFIMNLSVSDLMFCCFNLPLAASTFYSRSWRHGKLLCQLFPFLRYGLLAVSLFTVLAIAINRYVMIGHPTLYPMLYRREYLGLMVACTWVCGFGALIATWLGAWGQFGLDRQIGSCSILPDEKGRSPKTFLFMVAFVIPCIAIVVCYARIFFIVRRTALRSHSTRNSRKSSSRQASGSSSAGSSGIGVKRFLASKKIYGGEDSVVGTSTTGTSCTISTERSSSTFYEGVHPKNGAEKSSAAFETEIKQNILNANQAERMENRAAKGNFEEETTSAKDECCCPDRRPVPNFSFLHRTAASEPETDASRDAGPRSATQAEWPGGEDDDGPGPVAESSHGGTGRRGSSGCGGGRRLLRLPATGREGKSEGEARGTGGRVVGGERGAKRSISLGFILRRGSCSGPGAVSSGGVGVGTGTGKMSSKDKKLLKMILVIFMSFLVCYLPITISKTFRHVLEIHSLNIAGYVLIYLTTCINPIIYVVMSSEYRQAYKNLLTCRAAEATQQSRSGNQRF